MQILQEGITVHSLASAEGLSEWRQPGLLVRVPERLSLLGTKEKCKLSIRLTMVIIRRILLQGHSWSQITYSLQKKAAWRPSLPGLPARATR